MAPQVQNFIGNRNIQLNLLKETCNKQENDLEENDSQFNK